MICPYNRKALKQVVHTANNLTNEDVGIIKGYQTVLIEEYTMMDCPQEGCGAWQDGRCNYNQGNNG